MNETCHAMSHVTQRVMSHNESCHTTSHVTQRVMSHNESCMNKICYITSLPHPRPPPPPPLPTPPGEPEVHLFSGGTSRLQI